MVVYFPISSYTNLLMNAKKEIDEEEEENGWMTGWGEEGVWLCMCMCPPPPPLAKNFSRYVILVGRKIWFCFV